MADKNIYEIKFSWKKVNGRGFNKIHEILMQIHLKNVRLYAYHGLHAGEEIIGNEYELNLTVSYTPVQAVISNIDQTLNYVELYDVVKEKMSIRVDLLETLATEITHEIMVRFLAVEFVEVSIFKLHPPISQFQGSVGVTHKRNR